MDLAAQAIAAYQQLVANQEREAEARKQDNIIATVKACKRECMRLFNREPDNVFSSDGTWYAVVEGVPFVYTPQRYGIDCEQLYALLEKCEKCGEDVKVAIYNIEDLGKVLLNPELSQYHTCEVFADSQPDEPKPPSVEQLVIQALTLLIEQVLDGR